MQKVCALVQLLHSLAATPVLLFGNSMTPWVVETVCRSQLDGPFNRQQLIKSLGHSESSQQQTWVFKSFMLRENVEAKTCMLGNLSRACMTATVYYACTTSLKSVGPTRVRSPRAGFKVEDCLHRSQRSAASALTQAHFSWIRDCSKFGGIDSVQWHI
eukprot:5153715-Amphidinium_carterae.1